MSTKVPHIEHFIEEASETGKIKGQEILTYMDAEDLHSASHEMEKLLAIEGHAD
jgi:hypothetical protein